MTKGQAQLEYDLGDYQADIEFAFKEYRKRIKTLEGRDDDEDTRLAIRAMVAKLGQALGAAKKRLATAHFLVLAFRAKAEFPMTFHIATSLAKKAIGRGLGKKALNVCVSEKTASEKVDSVERVVEQIIATDFYNEWRLAYHELIEQADILRGECRRKM